MTEFKSVVVEREFAHPPSKLWRALTQPHLIEDWLMKIDAAPDAVGRKFHLTGDWGGVLDCEVLTIEPERSLAYRWDFDNEDPRYALKSVVTFTLTPTDAGTHLKMEQAGFRPDQPQAYGGARHGWAAFLDKLDGLMERGGMSDKPVLLSGDNPQIPKGFGDAPVQAYIDAVPGWKQDVCRRLDALIVATAPGVLKAVKWNTPMYAVEEGRWFTSMHCYKTFVRVTFFQGTQMTPVPAGPSKVGNVRYHDIKEGAFDDAQLSDWIKQAAALPGEKM